MIDWFTVQHVPCSTARAISASAAVLCFVSLVGASFAAAPHEAAPVAAVSSPVSVPAWAIGAKWYLVDVPHFANGDKSNDPPGTLDWPTGLPSESNMRGGVAEGAAFSYGGDLAGLVRRLPYLADLGVNTLYLTGLSLQVKTPSVPKLADFLTKAHSSGLRVMLVAPFDRKEITAITRRWMDPNGDGRPDDGVDGWVVPWPADLPKDVLRRWREQVKSLNPEALIVADAPRDTLAAVASGVFDTVINHSAGVAIRRFFREAKAGKAPAGLFDELVASLGGMSLESRLASPVLLGSWTTSRHTVAPDASLAAQWRLATVFQHFFAGSPITYYGDEMGLRGGKGGQSLRVMLWPDLPGTDPAVQKHRDDFASLLQWLHARRGVDTPLRRGDFRPVLADGERRLLAFARSTGEAEVIVLMNYGATKQQVMLPAGRPGMKVSVLTPLIDPNRKLPFRGNTSSSKDRISPRRMAASRQVIKDDGLARLWVDPMSIRVVLTSSE